MVVFTKPERARAFAQQHGLERSTIITPPNAEAAFGFLRQIRANDGIEWASVNAGHPLGVPFYLDALDFE